MKPKNFAWSHRCPSYRNSTLHLLRVCNKLLYRKLKRSACADHRNLADDLQQRAAADRDEHHVVNPPQRVGPQVLPGPVGEGESGAGQ